MNEIRWHKRAKKQLSRIPGKTRTKVFYAVSELKSFPNCTNVKPLKNHDYDYRLRVGRYRVLFDYDVEIRIISIQEVKKRDDRTY